MAGVACLGDGLVLGGGGCAWGVIVEKGRDSVATQAAGSQQHSTVRHTCHTAQHDVLGMLEKIGAKNMAMMNPQPSVKEVRPADGQQQSWAVGKPRAVQLITDADMSYLAAWRPTSKRSKC